MHQKVFGNKKKEKRKKKKNNNKKTKKQTGDWPQCFWLTFYSSSFVEKKKICIYLRKNKNKWTDPRIGSRWLAGKPFGWRNERNRCGESFPTPTVTLGHVSLKKEKHSKNAFIVTFCSWFFLKPTMNIYTHKKKKSGHFLLKKSETTLNNEYCLAGSFCPCPFPPFSFLYSLYLWFLIVALGTCL